MIEDLYKIGLSKELIDKMLELYGESEVSNLAYNFENVKKVIELFKSYGIENIEELLLYKDYIFFKNCDEIKDEFVKYNIPSVVGIINEDYNFIDEIL